MKESYDLVRMYYQLYNSSGDKEYLRAAIEILNQIDENRAKYLVYRLSVELEDFEIARSVLQTLPKSYKDFIEAMSLDDDVLRFRRLVELLDANLDILDYYAILINIAIPLNRDDVVDRAIQTGIKNLIDDDREWLVEFSKLIDTFRQKFDGKMLEIIMDSDYNILHVEEHTLDTWNRMFASMNIYRAGETYKIYLPKQRDLYYAGITVLSIVSKIDSQEMLDALMQYIESISDGGSD
ncbi:MAG: hypothetical protein N3C61_01385 [Candidatus Micrarchaeota archaeon]|nr:hypothetical protein [Candidatus Micrarchaeota archaeon]